MGMPSALDAEGARQRQRVPGAPTEAAAAVHSSGVFRCERSGRPRAEGRARGRGRGDRRRARLAAGAARRPQRAPPAAAARARSALVPLQDPQVSPAPGAQQPPPSGRQPRPGRPGAQRPAGKTGEGRVRRHELPQEVPSSICFPEVLAYGLQFQRNPVCSKLQLLRHTPTGDIVPLVGRLPLPELQVSRCVHARECVCVWGVLLCSVPKGSPCREPVPWFMLLAVRVPAFLRLSFPRWKAAVPKQSPPPPVLPSGGLVVKDEWMGSTWSRQLWPWDAKPGGLPGRCPPTSSRHLISRER